MRIIDSHCHIQSLDPDDREAALDAARERGVGGFMIPGIRMTDADVLLDLCARHDDVWCSLGVHPHDAESWQEGDAERLADLSREPKVVAIGECGLDFFYDNAPRETQERVMREQWDLALDLDLPVVVHNRDSNEAMLRVFREPRYAELQADFHSFAGGLDMGRELVERGAWLGFTGMVTFKRADNVREVLPLVPEDRLLVETDTPYLAPVPYRGKPNRPAYVVEVLDRVADERGWTVDEAAEKTTESFFGLFSKAATDGA
ncbi:MAG: TatD family hydrolase [Acidobacteriota bacterium]